MVVQLGSAEARFGSQSFWKHGKGFLGSVWGRAADAGARWLHVVGVDLVLLLSALRRRGMGWCSSTTWQGHSTPTSSWTSARRSSICSRCCLGLTGVWGQCGGHSLTKNPKPCGFGVNLHHADHVSGKEQQLQPCRSWGGHWELARLDPAVAAVWRGRKGSAVPGLDSSHSCWQRFWESRCKLFFHRAGIWCLLPFPEKKKAVRVNTSRGVFFA